MPGELRNRTTRIDVEGGRSAGSVLLVDERWRRRPVGIVGPPNGNGQPLLSQSYYLERALEPFAEIRRGRVAELLKRQLAVLIYADSGPDSPAGGGGGRQMDRWWRAAAALCRAASAETADPLLPVQLRRGGRTIGGAMSWERPAKLAPFARRQPVRRAGGAVRCHGLAPGAGRARYRAGRPDLGAAG